MIVVVDQSLFFLAFAQNSTGLRGIFACCFAWAMDFLKV
jgi:hypothetical protein